MSIINPFRLAVFSLNQWSLDFDGNIRRIIKSIDEAYASGAIYRVGPELELCGYSLEDAFYENDTVFHCWHCLGQILNHSRHMDLVIDIGMPVHYGSLYNCRVLAYKGKVICIRAKTSLAKEGNYREFRHFSEWPVDSGIVPFKLPSIVVSNSSSSTEYVPFGANFILELIDKKSGGSLKLGWDICQELWDIKNISSDLYQNFGCHLVVNSSGSYWELRKLENVNDIVKGISLRGGACYAFSNLVGCDGQRYVFYGRSCIYDRGRLVNMTPHNSSSLLNEVQLITYDINTREIDEFRAQNGIHPKMSLSLGRIWDLSNPENDCRKLDNTFRILTLTVELRKIQEQCKNKSICLDLNPKIRFEEEIDHYVSLWLWDYLRRSRMKGFMMPLSGGLDSSTVAVLVYSMCRHVFEMLDDEAVQEYFRFVHKLEQDALSKTLSSPKAICNLLLRSRYISTEYSSKETENRAKNLSDAIGADHTSVSIQEIYEKCRALGSPKSQEVSLLDQNIQARIRMTVTYYLSDGDRIVLATGNVDEGIMGYLTKYDCSSADINPIGGLCKNDLRSYLKYCRSHLLKSESNLVATIDDIIEAPPSAELTGSEQRDEDEMGITYDEISVLGKVRRGIYGVSGPRGAFETVWLKRSCSPFCDKIRCLSSSKSTTEGEMAEQLAILIKRFYTRYVKNRHKLTVLTPALHAESYSPDDNRFDHRQFLYPSLKYQFEAIDMLVKEIKQETSH